MERFDAVVVGAGQAGPGVAVTLAAEGARVALVEADRVGGTCLNHGCRPTKALRASARRAHLARTGEALGVRAASVTLDWERARQRKDALIEEWRDGFEHRLGDLAGIEIVRGEGRLAGTEPEGHVVAVGDRRLLAPKVYLDVGGRPRIPDITGLDDVDAWTETELLEADAPPDHLVILGGGYLGVEFGQMFRRFGSDVTIVQRAGHLLPAEDIEISETIEEVVRNEGVELRLGVDATGAARTQTGVRLDVGDGPPVEGTALLIAVGRTPNTDRLGLHTVGLRTDERGFVPTDDRFATAVEGIWALGDMNGRGAFTHTAYQDFEIVVDGGRTAGGRIATYAVFCDPALGRVGMTERQAIATGRTVLVGRQPMGTLTRARLEGDSVGLMKLVVDGDTDEILGAAVLGDTGDEVIQVVSALMQANAPARVLREMLPVHPTVSEFWPTVAGSLEPVASA
ncbi:MAG: mercuric reductase [Actinomycetota bacterium]